MIRKLSESSDFRARKITRTQPDSDLQAIFGFSPECAALPYISSGRLTTAPTVRGFFNTTRGFKIRSAPKKIWRILNPALRDP